MTKGREDKPHDHATYIRHSPHTAQYTTNNETVSNLPPVQL